MAIDTRNKRASCVSVRLPFGRAYPNPDGSLANAADRQHVAYVFPGIAASPPSAPSAGGSVGDREASGVRGMVSGLIY